MTNPNPLLPGGYEFAFYCVAGIILILAAIALFTLIKHQRQTTTLEFFVWLAVILLIPIGGAVVFLASRHRALAGLKQADQNRR